jgi:nitrogen fixation/metabolism regulation signal transduction histidine kinase
VEEAFQRYEMKMENARLTCELQMANDELRLINYELEQRVEEKTREVMRNLNILKVSQEVLERLPVAVVGIGDDGIIAVANHHARHLLAPEGPGSMLGELASDVIPAELRACVTDKAKTQLEQSGIYRLADGRQFRCWCSPMGEISTSKGVVLVLVTEQ